MDKGILGARDNPKALLVPGAVPLPVHNIIQICDNSDSEDNDLPSTVDFDALKVPGLPETSFQNVMCWRSTPTPRMKTKQSISEVPKKEQGNVPSSFVTEAKSVSDVSKNTEDFSSDSQGSESETNSSSDSGSSTASSVSSASSDSGSDSGKSANSDARKKLITGKTRNLEGTSIRKRLSRQSKDTQSISNSSSSSRSKNQRNKSYSIRNEPGSLRLKLAAAIFDPSISKLNNANEQPATTNGNKWKIAKFTNGGSPAEETNTNGECERFDEKMAPLEVDPQSTTPIKNSTPSGKVESRRVTRQSLSRKLLQDSAPSVEKGPKAVSVQMNGLLTTGTTKTELSLSLTKPEKEVSSRSPQPLSFKFSNNTFVPVGQTSQLTDSVTMTRVVSAPVIASSITSESVQNLVNSNLTQTPPRQLQKTEQQQQLSDPVLYLTKKSSDLSIFPISPDRCMTWTSPSKPPNPKVIITPTKGFLPDVGPKGPLSTSPPRPVRRFTSQRKVSLEKSDVESWDGQDLGINEAIQMVDSVLDSENSFSPRKSLSNGSYTSPLLDAFAKYGCTDVTVKLPSKLDLSIRPIVKKIPESHLLSQNQQDLSKESRIAETNYMLIPPIPKRMKTKSEDIGKTAITRLLDVKGKVSQPTQSSNSRTNSIKKTSNNKLSIFVTSGKASSGKIDNSEGVSKNGIKSSSVVRKVYVDLSDSNRCETNKTEVISEKQNQINGRVTRTREREDSLGPNSKTMCRISSPESSITPLKSSSGRSPGPMNISSLPEMNPQLSSGKVRTKAAKKYIPEVPVAETLEEAQVLTNAKLVQTKLAKKLKVKKSKTKVKVKNCTKSIARDLSSATRVKKISELDSDELNKLCDLTKRQWNIGDPVSSGSHRKSTKKRSPTQPVQKKKNAFTFERLIFTNFSKSVFLQGSANKSHQRSQELSPSKLPISRFTSSGTPTRKKRGSLLPKCTSNTSLEGTPESATDLQKLPLKKRHGHHLYENSTDYEESSEESLKEKIQPSYTFGICALIPTIIPSIRKIQPTASTSGPFSNLDKLWPSFGDFYKEFPGGEVSPKAQQKRGRPKKDKRSKPNTLNSAISAIPTPIFSTRRSLRVTNNSSTLISVVEPKRLKSQSSSMSPVSASNAPPTLEEEISDNTKLTPASTRSQPGAKKKILEFNLQEDGHVIIDADSPIELIHITDTESSPTSSFKSVGLVTPSTGRKRRRANRTGFPSQKKKKRLNFPRNNTIIVSTIESTNGIFSAEEMDQEENFSNDLKEDEGMEEGENESSILNLTEGFSSSLTERVKIRRRNSIDMISKEEREMIGGGFVEVPGVVASFMDVPNPPIILPHKSNYLPAGLLSNYFKSDIPSPPIGENLSITELLEHIGPRKKEQICPLPARTGFKDDDWATAAADYKLPYDIWCLGVIRTRDNYEEWARNEEDRRASERQKKQQEERRTETVGLVKKKKIKRPSEIPESWSFKKLRSNIYFGYNKPPVSTEPEVDQLCGCKAGELKCGSIDCLNRMMYTECPPACGEICLNRKIQKHDWDPMLRRFLTEDKGYGVKSLQSIKKGDFILEYVGEVVPAEEFKKRMLEIYVNDTHHYCLQLDTGLVIDGHRSGGEGRFVNHSCEPNCEMQKWSVNGLSRMALFALRDIPAEEELSYDYNFSLYNETEGQLCYCNSKNCRGVIGGKSKNNGKDGSRRKASGRPKGPHGMLDTVLRGHHDHIAKMKVLSRKEIKFSRSGNVFLVRNYEKIRRIKGSEDDEKVNERVEKLMIGWANRYKPGLMKNKPIVLTDEDPKVSRIVRMSKIFYELYAHVTNAKDTSGKCVCEPFMEYPPKRRFPIFHSILDRQKLHGFKSVQDRICQGEYKSLQALEDDIGIVLTSFSQAYEAEKPEVKALVDRVKKIYKEAKHKAIQALEPFIVSNGVGGDSRQSPRGTDRKHHLPPFLKYEPSDYEDMVRCVCGTFYEEGMMIQCEKCLVWQHCDCMRMPYSPARSDFSQSGKGKKQKNPKEGTKLELKMEENRPLTDRKVSIIEKDKVEFDLGELISVKEEIPLMVLEEKMDFSEMETQVLGEQKNGVVAEVKDEKTEASYYCELCDKRVVDPEVPMGGSNDIPDQTFYLTLQREDGLILRRNDTVYVLRDWPPDQRLLPDATPRPRNTYSNAGPLIKEECDIFRIESLWMDKSGNRMVMGYNYLRPHETHHEPSRRFYPNEILKAPIHEIIGIELIHGRCWVLDTPTYCKGRPINCDEEHLYICDLRVNKSATSFDKIGKRSQAVCTKPFAFNYFTTKIKIQRNIHPHGPPSPDFKAKPSNNQFGGNDKSKSRKGSEHKYKMKATLTQYDLAQIAKKRWEQRYNLHEAVNILQSRIGNFTVDPIDLSRLLLKERSRKSKSSTYR